MKTDFRDPCFLRSHVKTLLGFYHPNVVDATGGYFQNFLDNGEVFAPEKRHLVSSTRIVFNYCKAYQLFGDEQYKQRFLHGLDYLAEAHWEEKRQGYHWTLDHLGQDNCIATDQTNYCYGLAFVVLAYASALEAGCEQARVKLENAYQLMEKHFWQPQQGIYADEASPDWSELSPYRGQNANMHACEALLAAYEATGESLYLERAYTLARQFSVVLADKAGGLVWEHYDKHLELDWEYNKHDPKHIYKPWGFQSGHQTEWSKLLLILHSHRPEPWMLARARTLFDRALAVAWDEINGGIVYGFDPEGAICDDDKYFWVQAETMAAAARLAIISGESGYWDWYDRIWQYCYKHLIDHNYGSWYRILTVDNKKYSEQKSIAGGKCDYHTIGACWDILRALG
ncbi:AGE family epimerase/isomerase [Sedimenticola sp.]|uniref:AGE family epimerase/isomerase n=1 Tax=Sedimenticola sp. TaxID=1940285 RepID=UPI003D116F9F